MILAVGLGADFPAASLGEPVPAIVDGFAVTGSLIILLVSIWICVGLRVWWGGV